MAGRQHPDAAATAEQVDGAGNGAAASSTELAPYDHAMFPNLLDQDPRAVMSRFAARFMKAETLEDLFAVLEGTSSQDLAGHSVEVRGVAWAPYESDRGVIPLAICDAVDLGTGEVIEFATTGEVLTMMLRRVELIGAFPFRARITSKKTRSGQNALNFERV